MTTDTFPVVRHDESGGFALYRGLRRMCAAVFADVARAKQFCIQTYGELPIRSYCTSEVLLDLSNPVHRALCRLEARRSSATVVAVGPQHYLIRRGSSRWATEVPIRYSVSDGWVVGRNDQEEISDGSE